MSDKSITRLVCLGLVVAGLVGMYFKVEWAGVALLFGILVIMS